MDVTVFRQGSAFVNSKIKEVQLVIQENCALSNACPWWRWERGRGPPLLPLRVDNAVTLTAGLPHWLANPSVSQRC